MRSSRVCERWIVLLRALRDPENPASIDPSALITNECIGMTDGELRDFCVQIVRDHIFKWQISPVPGKIDLSMTMGVLLPTAQPYVQFPWSWELHDGWGLSGMFTEFFRPKSDVLQQHKWDKEERRKITRQFWIFWVVIGLAAVLWCAIIGRQELLRISVSPKWTVR